MLTCSFVEFPCCKHVYCEPRNQGWTKKHKRPPGNTLHRAKPTKPPGIGRSASVAPADIAQYPEASLRQQTSRNIQKHLSTRPVISMGHVSATWPLDWKTASAPQAEAPLSCIGDAASDEGLLESSYDEVVRF